MGGFFATSVGDSHILGVEGWRFAFFLVASISVCTGILTLFMASDPRQVRLPVYWPSPLQRIALSEPACMALQ